MSNDVELVIKARNAASKAIEQIAGALGDLDDKQEDVARGAKQMDGLLGGLASEFRRLNRELGGLTAFGKITSNLDKAESAVKRLRDSAHASAQEFADSARESQKAARDTARLRAEADTLARAYRAQKDAVSQAKRAQSDANAELLRAEKRVARLAERVEKHTAQSPWSNAAVSASAIADAELTQAQSRADAATANYERLNRGLGDAKTRQKELTAAVSAAAAHEGRLTRERDRLAGATRESAGALAEARGELARVRQIATDTSLALGGVSGGQEQIAEATRKLTDELQRNKSVAEAMSRYATGSGGFADPKTAAALRKQHEEVERARLRWKELEAEIRRYARSTGEGGQRTAQQAAALRSLAGAAKAAKNEYGRNIAALARMQGSAQGSFAALSQVDGGLRKVASSAQEAASSNERATRSLADGWRRFLSTFSDDSRKAMSLMQRLRGEVLALATANLGLYNAIAQTGNVLAAYQTLESAQSRLGVVFKQNKDAVRTELLWLERQAVRLGIEFGSLSDEYGKFAIAGQSAGFQSENTRKIFVALAEAGRVNKMSADDMSGAFRALTQMISKGKVSAEELRQQLGDRMSGAFNIFADALGMTAAELDKMMEKGQVLASETNLVKFAEELTRRFGPELAASLMSTTTLIGQFQNEVFQARLRVGEGGFIDGFNRMLKEMTAHFRSREGRDFFLSLGAALGNLTGAVTLVVRNIDSFIVIVRLMMSYKVAQWTLTIVSAFASAFVPALVASSRAVAALIASLRAGTGVLATFATAARAVGAALMTIPAVAVATGAAFVISGFLGSWLSGVRDATAAVDEHNRIMGEVLSAYEAAADKSGDWAKTVKNVTPDQLVGNARRLRDEYDKIKKSLTNTTFRSVRVWQEGIEEGGRKLAELRQAHEAGAIGAGEYREALEKLYASTPSAAVREHIDSLLVEIKLLEKLEKLLGEASAVARGWGVDLKGVADIGQKTAMTIKQLSDGVENSEAAMKAAAAAAEQYRAGLEGIKGMIPELADEMKRASEQLKHNSYVDMLGPGPHLPEVRDLIDRNQSRIDLIGQEGRYRSEMSTPKGQQRNEIVSAVVREAAKYNLPPLPVLTTIGYETGGTFDPWQKGPNGHRGMIQWSPENQKRYNITENTTVAEQVKQVFKYLIDRGVKPGDGEARIYAAVNAGHVSRVNARDAHNGGAPGTVIDKVNSPAWSGNRAKAEALLKTYSESAKEAETIGEAERKANEEREKGNEKTRETLGNMQFENAQLDLKIAGMEKEAFIAERVRAAERENPNIDAGALEQIRQQSAAIWEKNRALAGETEEKKRIREVERELSNLETARNSLLQQRRIYEEQGNTAAMAEVDQRLVGINDRLKEAIQRAIDMWRALGGQEAEAAIARLEAAQLGLANIGEKALVTGKQLNETLAGHIVNAFDQFAQALANGENAIKALGNAFRQFAADFLIEIAKMILKQAVLNALQMGGGEGAGVGGFIARAITAVLRHDGGVVGESGATRLVSPSWFADAMRYHDGGIVGLRPSEIPAILERGEIVDPGDGSVFRQMFGQPSPAVVKVVNTFDAGQVLSEGLNTAVGEQTFVNFVRANSSTLREILGS